MNRRTVTITALTVMLISSLLGCTEPESVKAGSQTLREKENASNRKLLSEHTDHLLDKTLFGGAPVLSID